jgi:hypothetical protein
MSICDVCDKPDGMSHSVAVICNEGKDEGSHKLDWDVVLCPRCEGALADEISYLLGREAS